jgi:hypothetical protein
VKTALAALASLFLAAHLAFLPPSLEDIDSVNFALGVRDFDVARHQPHPPGYPVYVAMGKVSAAVLGGAEDPHAVESGLAAWSALAGAGLVVLLFTFFRVLAGGEANGRRAWWAMGIAVTCPLFWFTALRPLSDTTGLAAAVAAQVLLLAVLTGAAKRPDVFLMAGAFVAALAAGIRVQTLMLTAPLLLCALVFPRPSITLRVRAAALGFALAGVLVWGVPLLAASGGWGGYLTALGSQAGEDFTGVVMLWTSPRASVAVNAFLYSFVWPWGGIVLGAVVLGLAVIGALRLALTNQRAALLLGVAFGPYAVFHLLFHETITIRYALPLVVPIAFLASSALDWTGQRAGAVLSVAVIAASVVTALNAVRAYGSFDAPIFRALMEAREAAGSMPIATHAVFRRATEWYPPGSNLLRAPHGREWLVLVEHWRKEPSSSIVFVADPRRTDLALFDPHARELQASHPWTVPNLPYLGGIRPGDTDWYVLHAPGWMLERGWALSAELGGVAARDAAGPHLQPSVAWVRARGEPALLIIGGRNLGGGGSALLTLSREGSVIDRWEVPPGFFFRIVPLGRGALAGEGYVPLSVSASSPANQARVSLEQFDLQPDGIAMFGFREGWQEPEYNPITARSWRWMSERAVVWVRPIGREVTLRLTGESPLRYFPEAPEVRVTVAGQELTRFQPAADFTQEVRLPAELLASADGRVAIESTRWFSPADRGESADRRHLALRIYQASVR